MSYRFDQSLHALIEDQVVRTPEAVALQFGEQMLTYGEMNARANTCARYLQDLGVGPDTLVAVVMERANEMGLALLSVLKAGGAYLPLDPNDPVERINLILKDADVSVVLTQSAFASRFSDFDGTVFSVDTGGPLLDACSYGDTNLEVTTSPEHLAYVIYTSGSTGTPKGCMISNRAICNRLLWMRDQYGVGVEDRVLQKTPYTFDVSVWEFFLPLLSGARLVMAKPRGHQDSAYLVDEIIARQITVCHFVPSMLRFFLANPGASKCQSLRNVFVSGEALTYDVGAQFSKTLSARLHNLYGPTEAAVDVTYWPWEARADKVVPIGRTIENIQIHILDAELKAVADGESGELHIGGVGVARGYLNRPELTREKFIPDPFSDNPNARLFRSGDRARVLPDGLIEYLGRMDSMVKLRGFRIELGEIEVTLEKHDAVSQAVVVVQDQGTDDPKLVAYIVALQSVETKTLRDHVKGILPSYMVPNAIMLVDAVPLTCHGKVDQKALPWPVRETVPTVDKVVPPTLSVGAQKDLLSVCRDVLGLNTITSNDDLFEHGATSFTMMRLLEQVSVDFGVVVPPEVVLDDPRIQAIENFISQSTSAETNAVQNEQAAVSVIDNLRGRIAALLGMVTVGDDDDLFDLGATSFTVMKIADLIETEHGVSVPGDLVLDQPTLAALAAHVDAHGSHEKRNRDRIFLQSDDPGFDARDLSAMGDELTTGYVTKQNVAWLLSLLRQVTLEANNKYLYASAGGLNPIQTYIYVKPDGVQGVEAGVYYYNPVENALHPMVPGAIAGIEACFLPCDRTLIDGAGFALFFIAQMKSIAPIYKDSSAILTTLECGYMGQLLLSRQASSGVDLAPVLGVDFHRIRSHFNLDDEHRFIHCLVGGARGQFSRQDASHDRAAYLRETGGNLHGHCVSRFESPSFQTFLEKTEATLALPVPQDTPTCQMVKGAIRDVPRSSGDIALDEMAVDDRFFDLRSAKRRYHDGPVAFDRFRRFLSLLRTHTIGGVQKHLYPAIAGEAGPQIYLYVKEDGVEHVPAGVYRYDSIAHALLNVGADLSVDFKTCHTPFNRTHASMAGFAMFLIAPVNELHPLLGDDSIYAALLEAGYIGQLLLERQAELGMGVCPIGALRFDRIRADFKLDPADVLLHSFVCGAHELEAPFKWPALSCERSGALAEQVRDHAPTDIAIIGMAGRFPGADDLDSYWQNLMAGRTKIGPIPEGRAHLYGADQGGFDAQAASRRRGAFLNDIDCVDGRLFSITPSEAKTIDPQERLLLEVVWECLENSGYTSEALGENTTKVGVFVGAMWNDYQHYGRDTDDVARHRLAMSLHSSIANRISHVYDFNGPSLALNTSCSSGMTALHAACLAIQNGECDAAIVGAVNLIGHPYHFDMLEALDLLAKDGVCRPFGMDGDGWVAGEGVGAVLIRPQNAAETNRDNIQAIIKGTSAGHIGRSSRFGYPNAEMQQASIKAAIKNANVPVDTIHYVEAAATGAGMADAAEMSAIRAVFGDAFDAENPLRVGSVKGNIGHLESASAMSQLMKVVMQMQHHQLCPTVSIGRVNPLLKLQDGVIVLSDETQPWSCPSTRRRALINAFGATGSCGHVVVEEYVHETVSEQPQDHLIVVSAASDEQLRRLAGCLMAVATLPSVRLCDMAYSLMVGRVEMAERLAIIARSHDELAAKLSEYLGGGKDIPDCFTGHADEVTSEPEVGGMAMADIAQAWVNGAAIAWQALASTDARRVPLPTYPFAKNRHWIGALAQAVERFSDHQPVVALQGAAQSYLKACISDVSEVPDQHLGTRETFDAIGLTSLMIHDLNARLERDFGPLTKTLFFEHKSVGALADYLCEAHAARVASLCGHSTAPSNNVTAPRMLTPRPKSASIAAHDAIAIVGLGGRYPGADGVDELWENLKSGTDCITEIPFTRWDHAQYLDQDRIRAGTTYAKWGGFIEGYDRFDPLFFNITPKEAKEMDPQERLFLETVYQTFEDAGYSRQTLGRDVGRRVGVFVGVMYGEYDLFSTVNHGPGQGVAVGSSHGSIANRISYFFDLAGPSLAIDTMCSSSLTALHLAANSIKLGECEAAVVGGVNLSIHPNKYIRHAQANMSSSDGRCRSFGDGGDGFVPGEGVGAVLIKPLTKAIADGDQIYATIKGTAVNHDGRTHGYSVPNPGAQADMILDALERCGVDADTVSYVEAHGTGTVLGDPIEISGLTKAFRQHTERSGYCAIGSIKSNIGHLESAAGIAGLTKILLQMKHRTLVPSLHSKSLNPNIDFEQSPFFVQRDLTHWDRPTGMVDGAAVEHPRRACLSSFGAGGANAHAVIEEYTGGDVAPTHESADVMIVLSAHTADRLHARAGDLLQFVRDARFNPATTKVQLRQVAYTLQVGRDPLAFRLGFVVGSIAALEETLQGVVEGGAAGKAIASGQVRRGAEGLSCFAEDEDFSDMIDAWLAKRKYHALLDLWVDGLDINWTRLYVDAKPIRISMPVYPFAGERYWIDPPIKASATEAPPRSDAQTMLLAPVWNVVAMGDAPADFNVHHVCLCGDGFSDNALRNRAPGLRVTAFSGQFTDIAVEVFAVIKDTLRTISNKRCLVQVVVRASANEQGLAGLSGLLRTARLENPALMAQIITVDETGGDQLWSGLQACARSPEVQDIRYAGGRFCTRGLGVLDVVTRSEPKPWIDGGVYLISGGVGGLGLIFAEDIVRSTPDTKLILVGRSALNDGQRARLNALRSDSGTVDYYQVDVADPSAVADLVGDVLAEHGQLNGVLHAAGQHRDNFILKKQHDDVAQVLRPKVDGAVNLDEATKNIELDMFVLFSSLSGVTGNVGQADYACANAFLDAFADHRSDLVNRTQRFGRTVSIAWPLWLDGGMRVDAGTEQMMHERLGLRAMPSEAGCQAFRRALAMDGAHIIVAYGDQAAISAALVDDERVGEPITKPSVPIVVDTVSLRERTMQELKSLVSDVSGIDVSNIDAQEPLELYGIGSVMITSLNQLLREHFEDLPQTLFFEHQILSDLNDWLVDQHPDACAQWCGYLASEAVVDEPSIPRAVPTVSPSRPTLSQPPNEPIAIIGMNGRYPQAATLDAFWDNLKAGKTSIAEIPSDRWALGGFFVPDRKQAIVEGASYSKWGGFIDDFSAFDPLFFNISPREAMTMDPQERLFLQSCWAAMEDAGYTKKTIAEQFDGNVGVFVGVTKTGFELYGPQLWERGEALFPRTSFSSIANRVSYTLNLRGPSMPLDTMCSSSLTAIHEACEQLRRGDCEMAIAGAVNLYLHPSNYTSLCAYNMLSSDGLCKSFAQDADGFVPGEGVGAVMLKPLSRAVADGDQIHALILGSSVNHDGKTNGFTVPNPRSQGDVIRLALDQAGIDARNVSYIEAHGTGTQLGDPIEIAGLSQAFGKDTTDTGFCAIGSIKSNIGHLEAAAGLAGLTKIVLQMRNAELVPSLHADVLNDHIAFAKSPFQVQTTLADWSRPMVGPTGHEREVPRTAGLSSFGAGGANAHLIVQEYISFVRQHNDTSVRPVLILLSAQTAERLTAYAADVLAFVERHGPSLNLANFAYTLQIGREPMDERLGLVAGSVDTLCQQLCAFVDGRADLDGMQRGRNVQGLEERTANAADQKTAQHINAWLAQGNLAALSDIWVQGSDVDWMRLYGADKPQRISAPTYPFVRDTYWFCLPKARPAKPVVAPIVPQQSPANAKTWLCLEEQWQYSPADMEATDWSARVAAAKGDRLLVISEDPLHYVAISDVCDKIAETVQADGALWDVCHLPLHRDAQQPVDVNQFEKLMSADDAPNIIILVLDATTVGDGRAELLEQTYGCVRSLMIVAQVKPVRFYCCYREGADNDALFGEGLAGLLRSAMLESLSARYRSIALDENEFSDGRLALRLVREWLCDDTTALNAIQVPMVRYGSSARYELQVSEAALDRAAATSVTFKPHATYLVVGGMGELGVSLCCELGRRYQPQLVILSRRPQNAVQGDLDLIAASGAEVQYRSVDILDKVALDRVMSTLKTEGISFSGVVHMARRVLDAPIISKSFEDFASVAGVKVEGTLTIDAVTADQPLDFFLMFSSMAAFGIRGSADYAYATAFQNGFARHRNRLQGAGKRSGITTAVCWGQWDRDGGVEEDKMQARLQHMHSLGSDVIDTASAVDVLARLGAGVIGLAAVEDAPRFLESLGLVSEQPCSAPSIEDQIVAFEIGALSKADFSDLLKGLSDQDLTDPIRAKIIAAFKRCEGQGAPISPPQPQASSAPVAPAPAPASPQLTDYDNVQVRVFESMQEVLKIRRDQINVEKSLQDYGLDSITAMQLAANIEKDLKISVPTRWLIEYPTLEKLIHKVSEIVA